MDAGNAETCGNAMAHQGGDYGLCAGHMSDLRRGM